jgi:AraC family transcriptional regulator
MGVSVCNEKDEWEYYIAVATTKPAGEFEELIVPKSTWAVFYDEGPVIKMQELETRIVTEWLPTSGYEYANAPEIELYLNPDPEQAKYEIWLPIVRKGCAQ